MSSGLAAYQGLPGLAVWVEDYYRTIEILDLSYDNDVASFSEKYGEKLAVFRKRQKEKGVDDAKEPLVMIQKGGSVGRAVRIFPRQALQNNKMT